MSDAITFVCWIVSVALNSWLLLSLAPRVPAAALMKRAALAFAIAPVILLAIMLAVFAIGNAPSDAFGDRLFQSFFAVEIMAMLSIGNTIFHGMVASVIAFHRRMNAANLHRFPVSFLIDHEQGLKLFGTLAWCAGGALMLYGVWFDTHV